MQIEGLEGLSVADVRQQVQSGGKFVVFSYTMSFLVVTLRRSSNVHFIRAGESTFGKAVPYLLLSLVLGWWGFPWGFIYTPMSLIENLNGGKDVTGPMMQSLAQG